MSNASKDRKISEFQSKTSLPSNSELTIVSGATNYKISLSDFQSSLGVTGTIVQDGAATGVPVLDKAGSVNNIRNIEAGSGITASVSPENGVTIEHNFTQDTDGVTLVSDLTADQPEFRSLVAGSGINVSASNGTIQISTGGAPASTKTVLVNDISDFPTASAGVITLADDTEYLLRNDITTASRFIVGDNTLIAGSDSSSIIQLSYTGSGTMFSGTNKGAEFKDIRLVASSGTMFDITGTGAETIQILNCSMAAATIGEIGDFDSLQIENTKMDCTTDGLLTSGANRYASIRDCRCTATNGDMFDLGTATFDGISFKTVFSNISSGASFISGAASSANLNAGALGTIFDCRQINGGSFLSGITGNDLQWQFALNDTVDDTHYDGMLSLIGNSTYTTISAVNTPALVAGTWTVEHSTQFTGITGGRLTYNGLKSHSMAFFFGCTTTVLSGTNKDISLYLAKNGSVIANSKAAERASSGAPTRVSQQWIVDVTTGDYFEIFCENNTDDIDILVSNASFSVN